MTCCMTCSGILTMTELGQDRQGDRVRVRDTRTGWWTCQGGAAHSSTPAHISFMPISVIILSFSNDFTVHLYSANPYLGGPNITPSYSPVTGKLEEKSHGQDSGSSSSESESSHGSRFDTQSSSSRCGGIRMNKDEKLAREAGIQLSIKVIGFISRWFVFDWHALSCNRKIS